MANPTDSARNALSSVGANGPANVALSKVVYVNPREFTLDAIGIFTERTYTDIPFMTPYQSREHPGGVSIMPEVESMCYVCSCADGTTFVLGFITDPRTEVSFSKVDGKLVPDDGGDQGPNFRGDREFLEPGDVFLGTQDDNKIVLRRGGMVQIGATGLAQRFYLPIDNLVRDYFQRYQAFSPLGEIEWGHAQLIMENDNSPEALIAGVKPTDEDITATKTPVLVRYSIKDIVQEVASGKTAKDSPAGSSGHRNYTVEVRLGRLTSEALDTEIDNEHIFGNPRTVDSTKDGGLRLHAGLKDNYETADDKTWEIRKSRGVLSFTIWPHDDAEGEGVPSSKEKVTYAFQLSKDGDHFLHSKGHIHVELDKTVYANVVGGVKIEYGSEAVGEEKAAESSKKQALLELTNSCEFKATVQQIVLTVIEGLEFNGKTFHVKATQADGIELGSAVTSHAVKFEELKTFLNSEIKLMTAWGPTSPGAVSGTTSPTAIDNAKSVKVKVE